MFTRQEAKEEVSKLLCYCVLPMRSALGTCSVENAPGANFRGVKGADAASGKTVGKLLKKTGKPGAAKPSKSAKLKAKAKKVVKKQRKQTKKAAAK